jgi:hypothetical protein
MKHQMQKDVGQNMGLKYFCEHFFVKCAKILENKLLTFSENLHGNIFPTKSELSCIGEKILFRSPQTMTSKVSYLDF